MHAHLRNFFNVVIFVVLVAAAPGKDSVLEARAGCNADNVLRALQRNSRDADNFCFSILARQPRGPTTTLVTAGVTPAPVIVTTTSTLYIGTVYPNGLALEELPYPTYVSQYPVSRVSSACSCFSPNPTTTVTATGPTDTSTVFITRGASTLNGTCATAIEYPGAYDLAAYQRNQFVTTINVGLSNAYDCCNRCNNYAYRSCLAYFNIPGVSCKLLVANVGFDGNCKIAAGNAGIRVATSSVPNNLGGRGPCANSITVITM